MYTRIRISGFFSRVTYVFVLEKTKGILNSPAQQNLMPSIHSFLSELSFLQYDYLINIFLVGTLFSLLITSCKLLTYNRIYRPFLVNLRNVGLLYSYLVVVCVYLYLYVIALVQLEHFQNN
jgi:hypothetical protein